MPNAKHWVWVRGEAVKSQEVRFQEDEKQVGKADGQGGARESGSGGKLHCAQ